MRHDQPLPPYLASGRALTLVLVVYALMHCILRLSLSQNFVTDDVESILYTNEFRVLYTIYQPPLYEWILWVMRQIFGVSFVAILATKYLLLGATCGFLYQAALLVIKERGWAVLAVFSYFLFYQIAWNLLEGAPHTTAVIFATSATLWAFLNVLKRQSFLSYLILGIAIGLGFLAKFSFMFFLIALIIAAFSLSALRKRLSITELCGSVLLGALLASPFWWEMLDVSGALEALFTKMDAITSRTELWVILIGPLKVLVSFLLYPLIFFPAVLFFFFQTKLREGETNTLPVNANLCLRLFAISFIILFLGTLALGIENIKERHMHPFFLALPLAVFALAEKRIVHPDRLRLFCLFLLVAAVGVLFVRFVTLAFPYEAICGRCRERIPYEALAEKIKKLDVKNIIATDAYNAANLMRLLPDKTIIHAPRYAGKGVSGGCVIVWQEPADTGFLPTTEVNGDWFSLFGKTPIRKTIWKITVADGIKGRLICPSFLEAGT